jgi:hypothetical protein
MAPDLVSARIKGSQCDATMQNNTQNRRTSFVHGHANGQSVLYWKNVSHLGAKIVKLFVGLSAINMFLQRLNAHK